MKPNLRTPIAYVAACAISANQHRAIYCKEQEKQIVVSESVTENSVLTYDHDQGCYLLGSREGGPFKLYHHGEGLYFSLDIQGNCFLVQTLLLHGVSV
jgi:hypothetical protein